MCLIIHKPANKQLDPGLIKDTYTGNSDGFGLMFAEGGTVAVHKILPKNWTDCLDLYKQFEDRELAVHFRLRTHGNIDQSQAHPYEVFNRNNGDPVDLYLMHNGILSEPPEFFKEKSDTWHFIEYILRPMLDHFWRRYGTDPLDDFYVKEALESLAGSHNKLLLMDHEGKVTILNKQAGQDKDGLWLSNGYAMNRKGWGKGWEGYFDSDDGIAYLGRQQGAQPTTYAPGKIFTIQKKVPEAQVSPLLTTLKREVGWVQPEPNGPWEFVSWFDFFETEELFAYTENQIFKAIELDPVGAARFLVREVTKPNRKRLRNLATLKRNEHLLWWNSIAKPTGILQVWDFVASSCWHLAISTPSPWINSVPLLLGGIKVATLLHTWKFAQLSESSPKIYRLQRSPGDTDPWHIKEQPNGVIDVYTPGPGGKLLMENMPASLMREIQKMAFPYGVLIPYWSKTG